MDRPATKLIKTDGDKRNIMLIPALIVLIGALIAILSFFLPFASANKDYREYLEDHPSRMYIEEIGMTNKEAVGISLFEFAKLYMATAQMGMQREISILCVVLISLIALFSLLTLLFAAFKRPIALFVFYGLTFGIFRLLVFDFEDRGILPSGHYNFGISYYLYHICIMLILVGAVWLFVAKRKLKKQNRILRSPNMQQR